MSYCLGLENNTNESVVMLNKAIAMDTLNYAIYQKAGLIYQQAKRPAEAIYYFTKGITINPEDPRSYIYRSNCYLDMKKIDNAMDDFDKAALKLKNNNVFKLLFDYLSLSLLENRIMNMYNEMNK